jgi:hypothetical protein
MSGRRDVAAAKAFIRKAIKTRTYRREVGRYRSHSRPSPVSQL